LVAPALITPDPTGSDGAFVRAPSRFRNWITTDGGPGPTGRGGFRAEPDRYHLYVALICPWAQRTLIFRTLKQLDSIISVSITYPERTARGWMFDPSYPGCTPDEVNGCTYLSELYFATDPHYDGRYTVPVLWDKRLGTIVNNESAEIIRMLNSAFDACTAVRTDYYPADRRAEIDAINALTYEKFNNGVYRAGFAASQSAYEQAYRDVFDAMDWMEDRLAQSPYLAGDRITEADWRVFPTLIRFDPVYYPLFKCNRRRLIDYPRLWRYTCTLYRVPGVAATCNMDHIKLGYWRLSERNPSGIVPLGPDLDFAL
jgi:putative glutathione S-transferase